MESRDNNLRAWIVTGVLALATLLGALPVLSIAELFGSEEAKVEITELTKFEIDAEEKIVVTRRRKVHRRSIVRRRHDTGPLHKPSVAEVASLPLRLRSKHNGCGSHLLV